MRASRLNREVRRTGRQANWSDSCAHSGVRPSVPEDIADVYRSTYGALVRFLYRKVWDAERAEDLAQEAFARALVHKPENARGWLFIVAANMARDEARRAARERRHLTLLTAEPQASAPAMDEVVDAERDRYHTGPGPAAPGGCLRGGKAG